jgi:hypothetical protein
VSESILCTWLYAADVELDQSRERADKIAATPLRRIGKPIEVAYAPPLVGNPVILTMPVRAISPDFSYRLED